MKSKGGPNGSEKGGYMLHNVTKLTRSDVQRRATCNATVWVPCNSVQWFTSYILVSSVQHGWSSSLCSAVQLVHGGPCTSRFLVIVSVR